MHNAAAQKQTASHGTRQIVLLGVGSAHLQLLAQLAAQPLAGTVVTLVAPQSHPMVASMVPSLMVGRYTPDQCTIAVQPLVKRGGVRWIKQGVIALDATNNTIQLDDGSNLHFDWLSVNTAPTQDRMQFEQAIPGAKEHALFVRPLESFSALWPRVTEMGDTRPLRITVIGAGNGGIEIAFAVRERLPMAAVTLLGTQSPAAASGAPGLQQRVMTLLKKHNITILQDKAVAIKSGFVQLGCGADLACDIPLLAVGTLPPPWLANSGLALNEQGFIDVDTYQRSRSHSHVFASGDISSSKGAAPARNLAAAAGGAQKVLAPAAALHLIACGSRYAVGSWKNYSFEGRWVWWLKDQIDRRFVVANPSRG